MTKELPQQTEEEHKKELFVSFEQKTKARFEVLIGKRIEGVETGVMGQVTIKFEDGTFLSIDSETSGINQY